MERVLLQDRRQPVARARLWQSMRILRHFTLPELVTTAESGALNAKRYAQALARAGILRAGRNRGGRGCHQYWLLVRDVGPKAPRLRKDGKICDPNTQFEFGVPQQVLP